MRTLGLRLAGWCQSRPVLSGRLDNLVLQYITSLLTKYTTLISTRLNLLGRYPNIRAFVLWAQDIFPGWQRGICTINNDIQSTGTTKLFAASARYCEPVDKLVAAEVSRFLNATLVASASHAARPGHESFTLTWRLRQCTTRRHGQPLA